MTIMYRGASVRLSDFSAKPLQITREWDNILKVLEEKNYQPSLLCPVKMCFETEEEIKIFPNKS